MHHRLWKWIHRRHWHRKDSSHPRARSKQVARLLCAVLLGMGLIGIHCLLTSTDLSRWRYTNTNTLTPPPPPTTTTMTNETAIGTYHPPRVNLSDSHSQLLTPSDGSSPPPSSPPPPRPPKILLVSAYFPLPPSKSKHSASEYDAWLANLFSALSGSGSTDVYFFAPPEYEEVILSKRQVQRGEEGGGDRGGGRSGSWFGDWDWDWDWISGGGVASASVSGGEEGAGDKSGYAEPRIYVNTTYTTIWDAVSVWSSHPGPARHTNDSTRGLGLEEVYARMWEKDRERERHSPELYAIWNSKPFFLDEGLRNANAMATRAVGEGESEQGGEGGYDYAFWIDAGSFRVDEEAPAYGGGGGGGWPDPVRIDEIWRSGLARANRQAEERHGDEDKKAKDELVLFPIWDIPARGFAGWDAGRMGPVDQDVSQGSFFGGMQKAIAWWRGTFYAHHDLWLEKGMFVGKDQTVINALFMLYPSHFVTVWYGDGDGETMRSHHDSTPGLSLDSDRTERDRGDCGPSRWYYYHFWLASSETRGRLQAVWDRRSTRRSWLWRWPWVWEAKGWWGSLIAGGGGDEDGGCRLAPVRSMREVMEAAFGREWEPVGSLIDGVVRTEA